MAPDIVLEDTMTRTETALALFDERYSCSQAVFAAFAGDYGLDKDMAMKISGPFGGGIATGDICGALSGAIIVLGLHYRGTEPGATAEKLMTMTYVRKMIGEFENAMGARDCSDILGEDMSTDEGRQAAHDKDLRTQYCFPCVKNAVQILEKLLASE